MLVFRKFKGQIASTYEQQFIESVINQLEDPNSFYSILQYSYNNNIHFSGSYNGLYNIKELIKKIKSPRDTIEVKGQIHTNFHSSRLLVDWNTGQGLFVTDTYIQIHDGVSVYHILLQPPKLNNFVNWVYTGNNPFIPPTF
jgi:hypothetical protein